MRSARAFFNVFIYKDVMTVTGDLYYPAKGGPLQSSQFDKIVTDDPYTHVIITRFSYRFTRDQPIGNLFDKARMQRRFELFETFCFPSICDQFCKNFYWVLVVDQAIPDEHLNHLNMLIEQFYESPGYETCGPRRIIIHQWTYRFGSLNVNWLKDIGVPMDKKYLITTRMDDDDAVASNFTELVRDQLYGSTIRGFYLLSFELGYYWYPNQYLKYGFYRLCTRPLVAIGLTLIVDLQKYPMTAYFGNHTKLIKYINNYQIHKGLKRLCERNNEPITDAKEKYALISHTGPVFIRTVHDQHLQSSMKNPYKNAKVADATNSIRKRFALNFPLVERMNRKFFQRHEMHAVVLSNTTSERSRVRSSTTKKTSLGRAMPDLNPVSGEQSSDGTASATNDGSRTPPSEIESTTLPHTISLTDL